VSRDCNNLPLSKAPDDLVFPRLRRKRQWTKASTRLVLPKRVDTWSLASLQQRRWQPDEESRVGEKNRGRAARPFQEETLTGIEDVTAFAAGKVVS
jgi:hypothetical protein